MMNHAQYASGPSAPELGRLLAEHVDALERHLSVNTWALTAMAVVLVSYPIARFVIPAVLHSIVLPEVVRTVLHLI